MRDKPVVFDRYRSISAARIQRQKQVAADTWHTVYVP